MSAPINSCDRGHPGCRTEILRAGRSRPKLAFIRSTAGGGVGVERAQYDGALWHGQE